MRGNVRITTNLLWLVVAAIATPRPAHAHWCDALKVFKRRPVPAIAAGIEVGPLAKVKWVEWSGGWFVDSFKSPWGDARISFNGAYLVISVRPIAGDLHLGKEVLARLRADLGPVQFREDYAVSFEREGDTDQKTGWVSLYVGRAQMDEAAYRAKASALLKLFFGKLPWELRQAPPNPTAIEVIPVAVQKMVPWIATRREWTADLKTDWGRVEIGLNLERLKIEVTPAAGDLVFLRRDLDALRAKVPDLRGEISTYFDPTFEMGLPNRAGRYDLQLTRGPAGPEDDARVHDVLRAFLADLPKAVRAQMLTGRRTAASFDPVHPASLDDESRHP